MTANLEKRSSSLKILASARPEGEEQSASGTAAMGASVDKVGSVPATRTRAMRDWPLSAAAQLCALPRPRAEIQPTPVTTTRVMRSGSNAVKRKQHDLSGT